MIFAVKSNEKHHTTTLQRGVRITDFASQSLYLWALWGFFFTYWGVNGDIFHYSSWKYLIW
jgi:hypothetical protein